MTKTFTKQDIVGVFSINGLQQSMLYRCRLEPHEGHYIEQIAFEFQDFDLQAMEKALHRLIKRYRALRSFFVWREQDETKLVTVRHVSLDIEQSSESTWQKLLAIDRKRGIALDAAPMMRMTVANLGKDRVHCLWSLHHAIVDGWSIVILQNELLSLYRECRTQSSIHAPFQEPPWPKLVPSPSKPWNKVLQNPPLCSNLGVLGGSVSQSSNFADLSESIDIRLTTSVQSWCRQQRITFASFMHGIWALLLAHINGHNDVIYGSIDSGRGQPQIDVTSVGMFMQLRPIRVKFTEADSIGEFLQSYQSEQLYLNTKIPPSPGELSRILNRPPGEKLFDSVLLVQNYPKPKDFQDVGLLNSSGYEQADAPLTVSIGVDNDIQVLFRYQTDRFNTEALQSLLNTFLHLMQSIVEADPDLSIYETLNTLSETTGEQLSSNGFEIRFVRCVTPFLDQVEKQPDSIALVDKQAVPYITLAKYAESIRKQLVQHNIEPGDIVAIHLSRSTEAVAAMLAVLALDACYLPIDPQYPKSHLEYILKDSGASLVLSNSTIEFSVPALKPNATDADEILVITDSLSKDAMCLMYTSGSTGNPKGVFLQHTGVANRMQWMETQYPFHNEELCCHRTPLSFVDSVCEIFSPLSAGVPAVIINDDVLTRLNEFIDRIQKNHVSRLTLVPSLLDAILDLLIESGQKLSSLSLCVVSGEALSNALAEKFYRLLPDCTLLNLYGSTEVTADALAYEVPVTQSKNPLAAIGSPISNMAACVTNPLGRPLPMNIMGELNTRGIGVTPGYHGQQNLTHEKFYNQSFKTGDLAYIDARQITHYCGRIDRQIKIRGQRVEPSAVEMVLQRFKGVDQSVVFEKNSRLIAAYVGTKSDSLAIKNKLAETLPAFSIPQLIVQIEKIPRLANGKTDYFSLNSIIEDKSNTIRATTSRAPLYERQLALTIGNIWQELLQTSEITEQSHFFDSGGHSILAMQMIARAERALGISISLPLLINNPVLINFATALVNTSTESLKTEIITLRRGNPKQGRALFCIHGDAYNIVPYIHDERPIYWISQWARRMELTKNPSPIEPESITQSAKRYVDYIEQTQPNAGYDLIASCGAAVVALEMAILLAKKGNPPVKLILMDLPKGELVAPFTRRLTERQSRSWLASLYHFTFRLLGGEAFSFRLTLRAIEKKIKNGEPLTDTEAKTYTDAQLYSALANYKPQVYKGDIELVFSVRWRRGITSESEASVPPFWSEFFTSVRGLHFSPVKQHNDLLQGEGAAFAASIVCSDSNQ